MYDGAVNSWANAPLLNTPIASNEPVTIVLKGSVDRAPIGDGLSIAVPADWTMVSAEDGVILKRNNAAVVVSIDQAARSTDEAMSTYSAHLRDLYASMTFYPPTKTSNGISVSYRGKYDGSKNATVVTGGFNVYERSGHPYVVGSVTYAGAYTPVPDPSIELMFSSLSDSFLES